MSNKFRCSALPGSKGLPGRKGLKGALGARGAPGLPARLPCTPPVDLKKICTDPCPAGKQGKQGPMVNFCQNFSKSFKVFPRFTNALAVIFFLVVKNSLIV